MQEDLDDGEIAADTSHERYSLVERPSYHRGRSDRSERDEYPRSGGRDRRRSPVYGRTNSGYSDQRYDGHDTRPRRYASPGSPRRMRREESYGRRYSPPASSSRREPRSEPSVRDAKTRADIERLERERQAAAYKAKTSSVSTKAEDTVKSESEKIADKPLSGSTSNNDQQQRPRLEKSSVAPQIERHPSSSHEAVRSRQSRIDGPRELSQADVARLAREREAAEYKARAQKAQKLVAPNTQTETSHKTQKPEDLAAVSKNENKVDAPIAPKKEVSHHMNSITPALDLQLAKLKEEHAILFASCYQSRLEAIALRRKLTRAEQDYARETYKSELAENSLTLCMNF